MARREGISFESVPSGPLSRVVSLRTLLSLAKIAAGIVRAYAILNRFKPDVTIGTGGYASVGVLIAQWLRGGKVMIHEQNVVPGRANRLLARIAHRICVTFEESQRYFPPMKTVLTGLPLRPEFADPPPRDEARKALGLESERFTLLVTGGSQGARRLNELTLGAVPLLVEAGVQVLHQTGQKQFASVQAAQPEGVEGYHIWPYIHEMAAAYAAADLVVARAGAATIADLTAVGRPAILVPYPFAGGHQKKNAESVAARGAAIVVEESELSPESLAALVIDLKDDPDRLAAMSAASAAIARRDAAKRIVEVAFELANG